MGSLGREEVVFYALRLTFEEVIDKREETLLVESINVKAQDVVKLCACRGL